MKNNLPSEFNACYKSQYEYVLSALPKVQMLSIRASIVTHLYVNINHKIISVIKNI